MKSYLVLLAVLAFLATTALAVPNVTEALAATGIHWNFKAPISNETIANATRATELNRVMYRNGTIGRSLRAVFINGTWVEPIDNATLAARAAEDAAAQLNTGEVRGCNINIKSGFTLDPFVGEWCSLDVQTGGFMFRGVRDVEGKLFLQRYRLSNKAPAAAPTPKLASPTAQLLQVDNEVEPIESDSDNVPPPSFLETEAETDAEEMEVFFDPEAEEELMFMQMDMQMNNYLGETAEPEPTPAEKAYKELSAKAFVKVLANGDVLPDIPKLQLGRCSAKAHEFSQCSETALLPLNGTEASGFCQDDQYSADTGIFLSEFTPRLKSYRSFLDKVAASSKNMAPTHKTGDSLNHEDDAVKFCFMPGNVVEENRYSARGNYHSTPVGTATGLFKPVLRAQCDSVHCKLSGLATGKKTTIVMNFKP